MKIGAIKKVCEDAGQFIILDAADGRQWITNGTGAYPIEGIKIGEESISALFDLDDKKAEKITIKRMPYTDERFTIEPTASEKDAEDLGAVWYLGDLYRAIKCEGGVVFVKVSDLKPAETKQGFVQFRERRGIIACYGDMFVSALVIPVSDEKARMIFERMTAILQYGTKEQEKAS